MPDRTCILSVDVACPNCGERFRLAPDALPVVATGWGLAAPKLTPREAQVAALVVQGLTNKQVGARLGMTEKRASTYRAHLLRRRDIGGIAGLVLYGVHAGWIGPDGQPHGAAGDRPKIPPSPPE